MAKTKGVQVSTTVSPELFAALEDHRWNVRKSKSEVVLAALEEYATNHGLTKLNPEFGVDADQPLYTPPVAPAPEA